MSSAQWGLIASGFNLFVFVVMIADLVWIYRTKRLPTGIRLWLVPELWFASALLWLVDELAYNHISSLWPVIINLWVAYSFRPFRRRREEVGDKL